MSVTESGVKFKSFEREVYDLCCEIGRDALREALAQYEVEISMNRDTVIRRCTVPRVYAGRQSRR